MSNPVASATARPPDSNGWYNHPVTVSFQGSAFSGIASCTGPVNYAGPSSGAAYVGGSCTDNAGKVALAGMGLRYDSSPPALSFAANTGAKNVALSWNETSDPAPLASVAITQAPGVGKAHSTLVYRGNSAGFDDTRVRMGTHYTFTVVAVDQAGNESVLRLRATPAPRLLSPASGARMTTPSLLTWTPIPGASYYNVQLYRSGKILSRWPAGASFQLKRTWRFDGRRWHLKPGRYRWYVWPGFGRRSAARYGQLVGTGTFVVVR